MRLPAEVGDVAGKRLVLGKSAGLGVAMHGGGDMVGHGVNFSHGEAVGVGRYGYAVGGGNGADLGEK